MVLHNRFRQVVAVALVAGLAACHPIDTWRSLTGADKNDPDPNLVENTRNLAAAEGKPYPNLASVPAPPIPTLTASERDKLTRSLIADSSHARYTEQKLLPGFPAHDGVPPPAPAAAAAPAAPAGKGGAAAAPAEPGKAAGAGERAAAERKPGEPPLPGPKESSLTQPEIRNAPTPEASRPPPPPPPVRPAAAPATPAEALNPQAVAEARPQAPPPPPAIAPPPPQLAAAGPAPAPVPAKPAAATLATLDFPNPAAGLSAADKAKLGRVAAQYRDHPGTVRVIVYASAGGGGDQLDTYRAALDRAQAVTRFLADAGIPVGRISTSATPARAGTLPGRIEVQLAP
jgi:outer membrane protein OmpA-like peptidoglycan-associated protein